MSTDDFSRAAGVRLAGSRERGEVFASCRVYCIWKGRDRAIFISGNGGICMILSSMTNFFEEESIYITIWWLDYATNLWVGFREGGEYPAYFRKLRFHSLNLESSVTFFFLSYLFLSWRKGHCRCFIKNLPRGNCSDNEYLIALSWVSSPSAPPESDFLYFRHLPLTFFFFFLSLSSDSGLFPRSTNEKRGRQT